MLAAYPAMIAGARIALAERYSSAAFWGQVVAADATILNTVSAINYFIWNTPPGPLDRAHRVSRIMAMPAPKDIYEPFEERFGIRFIEGYGLTETGMVTYPRPARRRDRELRRRDARVRERGRARHRPARRPARRVRSSSTRMPNIVMRTYAGMPEKTAEDFRNLKLHTGDLGRMDEDGYLYFLDRVKDYIRRRGENVSSVGGGADRLLPPRGAGGRGRRVRAREGASAEDEILVCIVTRSGRRTDLHALLAFCDERMPTSRCRAAGGRVAPQDPDRARQGELRDAGITADTTTGSSTARRPRRGGATTSSTSARPRTTSLERLGLDEDAVWAVLNELGPRAAVEGLASSSSRAPARTSPPRTPRILSEWQAARGSRARRLEPGGVAAGRRSADLAREPLDYHPLVHRDDVDRLFAELFPGGATVPPTRPGPPWTCTSPTACESRRGDRRGRGRSGPHRHLAARRRPCRARRAAAERRRPARLPPRRDRLGPVRAPPEARRAGRRLRHDGLLRGGIPRIALPLAPKRRCGGWTSRPAGPGVSTDEALEPVEPPAPRGSPRQRASTRWRRCPTPSRCSR